MGIPATKSPFEMLGRDVKRGQSVAPDESASWSTLPEIGALFLLTLCEDA